MFIDLLFVFWFFIPSGLANIAPIIAAKAPFLRQFSYPLDCYTKFQGKRVFGPHKTIRGLLAGIIVAIVTVYLQIFLYTRLPWLHQFVPLDYTQIDPVVLGILQAVGALLGDAIKSFFKRQIGIPSGQSWFPFDQIDYTLGAILFTLFYVHLSAQQYLIAFLLWFILHPITTFLGWLLKLKDSPI
jgi:CDP-2,3-bis-(O-geranylgeranyl)-sn-glycerol synthase